MSNEFSGNGSCCASPCRRSFRFAICVLRFGNFCRRPFRNFEHLRAEIEAGGFRAVLREREREVAGAAAQIQRAISILNFGEFNDTTLPKPVQAEALQVVDQIVSPRDGRKKIIDLGGALFAGVIKSVAHADSLAQRREQKSKPQK